MNISILVSEKRKNFYEIHNKSGKILGCIYWDRQQKCFVWEQRPSILIFNELKEILSFLDFLNEKLGKGFSKYGEYNSEVVEYYKKEIMKHFH